MGVSAVTRRGGVLPHAVRSRRILRLSDDERLVALVRAGDPAAFEAVYDRHAPAILSFCRHMLGSREEAEDAVQHVFLSAYDHLVDTRQPIQLRPWLYAIARNRCLSVLRARREPARGDAPEPATEGLAELVQRRADLRALLGDLARLPDGQRAALVLAELGDLSHREIGEVLECPREKVKALVFQARETLIAERGARELPCRTVRQEIAEGAGALRRGHVRRHLRGCAGCRAFRRSVGDQRRALALLLPVVPTLALKHAALAGALGGGAAGTAGAAAAGAGGGGGAAGTGGAVAAGGGAGGAGTASAGTAGAAAAGTGAIAAGAAGGAGGLAAKLATVAVLAGVGTAGTVAVVHHRGGSPAPHRAATGESAGGRVPSATPASLRTSRSGAGTRRGHASAARSKASGGAAAPARGATPATTPTPARPAERPRAAKRALASPAAKAPSAPPWSGWVAPATPLGSSGPSSGGQTTPAAGASPAPRGTSTTGNGPSTAGNGASTATTPYAGVGRRGTGSSSSRGGQGDGRPDGESNPPGGQGGNGPNPRGG